MRIPPLTIACALLFWGLETDRLVLALMLCIALEAGNFTSRRYDLDENDFVKISDLTSLIFIGGVTLILLNYEASGFLRIVAGWLPLILAPLAAAQIYSSSDTIVIGTRLGRKKKNYTHRPIDFRPYYLLVCLFAAAAGNSRSPWFFPVAAGLLALLLYANRGRSYRVGIFGLLVVVSLTLGWGASLALERGHDLALHKVYRYLYKYYRGGGSDPYRTHVNFGDTGKMKYSGEIVLRVAADGPVPLLREAAFTTYRRGDWFGDQGSYRFVLPVSRESWQLAAPPHPDGARAVVERNLPEEKGSLPAPAGLYRLDSATIFELERSGNGTLRAPEASLIATYEILYDPRVRRPDDLPTSSNLVIPEEERYAVEAVRRQLDLADRPAAERLTALEEFFRHGFSYSLRLIGSGDYATPLGNFLLGRKSGFCEYYATATALLLRALEIPSRYVVGYAVAERSALEGKYLVRSRHAHAWAEAYVDGRWRTVDTTPGVWLQADAEHASSLEPLRDVFAFLRYKYRLFRIGSGTDYTLALSVVVVLLVAFLVWRIYRRMRLERAARGGEGDDRRRFERVVTPLTPMVDGLRALGVERRRHESFASWARRCRSWSEFDQTELELLYRLHLRLRFDPRGGDRRDWDHLEQGAKKYLRELDQEPLAAAGAAPDS